MKIGIKIVLTVKERVHKFYTQDLALRAAIVNTTALVTEIAELQSASPIATIALGRVLTASVLLASQLREKARIGLKFEGHGPIGFVFAESSYESEVRAYCNNPQVDLPLKSGKWDISGAIGAGLLRVSRGSPFDKEPYHGVVDLQSGEVAEDIAHYLYQSPQIPSVVVLTVQIDKTGKVTAAGGMIVEVMPGASDLVLSTMEKNSKIAPPFSGRLLEKASFQTIVADYVHSSPLVGYEHPFDMSYLCRCSSERVTRTLSLLGKGELAEMVLSGKDISLSCEFCGKKYEVTIEELRSIAQAE